MLSILGDLLLKAANSFHLVSQILARSWISARVPMLHVIGLRAGLPDLSFIFILLNEVADHFHAWSLFLSILVGLPQIIDINPFLHALHIQLVRLLLIVQLEVAEAQFLNQFLNVLVVLGQIR